MCVCCSYLDSTGLEISAFFFCTYLYTHTQSFADISIRIYFCIYELRPLDCALPMLLRPVRVCVLICMYAYIYI